MLYYLFYQTCVKLTSCFSKPGYPDSFLQENQAVGGGSTWDLGKQNSVPFEGTCGRCTRLSGFRWFDTFAPPSPFRATPTKGKKADQTYRASCWRGLHRPLVHCVHQFLVSFDSLSMTRQCSAIRCSLPEQWSLNLSDWRSSSNGGMAAHSSYKGLWKPLWHLCNQRQKLCLYSIAPLTFILTESSLAIFPIFKTIKGTTRVIPQPPSSTNRVEMHIFILPGSARYAFSIFFSFLWLFFGRKIFRVFHSGWKLQSAKIIDCFSNVKLDFNLSSEAICRRQLSSMLFGVYVRIFFGLWRYIFLEPS